MRRLARLLLVVVAAGGGHAAAACPAVDHGHAAWTAVLARRVEAGRVDYAGLKGDPAPLDAYLATLSGACAADYGRWTPDERLAFWLNAYNAFTVRLILDHYPVAGIRKIGWLPGAAFRQAFIPMPGLERGTMSLDDVEHRTIRKDFVEPRIHFALVCAAKSCPPLRSEAYRAADLDRQLDDQARAFLGDPRKNRYDPATRTLFLSPIFEWFQEDFERGGTTLPAFVGRWVPAAAAPDVRVEFLEYDWSLNDRAAP